MSRPAAAGRIVCGYRVRAAASDIERAARAIAYEQTVEVPEALVPPRIRDEVVGRVEGIEPLGQESFRATISYDPALAAGSLPQLLNLVYGNVSLQSGIRLEELELPEGFLEGFSGPAWGAEGLRRALGVHGRPLLASALKPSGARPEELARLAGDLVRGGVDLVKDDQNLSDPSLADFHERVARCQEAVEEACRDAGRRALYCPVVNAREEELDRRLEAARRLGVRGAMLCPMLIGLDAVRALAERHRLLILAHPAFTGAYFQDRGHGVAPWTLLGTLFRLAGADVSIFPNRGGRFPFTAEDCARISAELRKPRAGLKPALPAPAGGMTFERLGEMASEYGEEAVFLVGGALLGHSDSPERSARAFLDRIRGYFPGAREESCASS